MKRFPCTVFKSFVAKTNNVAMMTLNREVNEFIEKKEELGYMVDSKNVHTDHVERSGVFVVVWMTKK